MDSFHFDIAKRMFIPFAVASRFMVTSRIGNQRTLRYVGHVAGTKAFNSETLKCDLSNVIGLQGTVVRCDIVQQRHINMGCVQID